MTSSVSEVATGPGSDQLGEEVTAGPDRTMQVRTLRATVRSWPLLVLAAPAAVAVWSGWVGIGQMTGFGEIHPLPGIWDSLRLDTAVTLPIGVEAYAAFALRVWLAKLAIDICADCRADGLGFDFACGDEVYGSCTQLREYFEGSGQAYVLRVAKSFRVTLAPGTTVTCADAVNRLLKDRRRWEVRSAGKGSRGERWYAWAWIGTAPRHHLLIRRHLRTGELAFHYCYVPGGQLLAKARLVRAAGLRWPVEEDFRTGKDSFGLDQCQARLCTAIQRHIVLVMAALAICAVTAAALRDRTDAQAPPPVRPGQAPPACPGLIPLTVPEVKHLLAAALARYHPSGHAARWLTWRRRHQARSRWFHQRARLSRQYALVS